MGKNKGFSTVGELIELLSAYDEDMLVVKAGYEGNYEVFTTVDVVEIEDTGDDDLQVGNYVDAEDEGNGVRAVYLTGRTH